MRRYLLAPARNRAAVREARALLSANLERYLALPFNENEQSLWHEVRDRLVEVDRLLAVVLSQQDQTVQALMPFAMPVGDALDAVDQGIARLVAFNAREAGAAAAHITALRTHYEKVELTLDAISALLMLAAALLAGRAIRQFVRVLEERNRLQATRAAEWEQSGRRSEQKLRLLIDSIKDYAVFMLDCEGLVASWNPGAEHIKQYRANEDHRSPLLHLLSRRRRARGQMRNGASGRRRRGAIRR